MILNFILISHIFLFSLFVLYVFDFELHLL